MDVAMLGASGFIGTAVVAALRARGDGVVAFVRDPETSRLRGREGVRVQGLGELTAEGLAGIGGVVNLAGESLVGRRWTAAQKARIRDSRVETTRRLVGVLEGVAPEATLVNASAIGYYGDRGDEELDEASAQGTGFLATLCGDWEAEAQRAERRGRRVVRLRTGLALGNTGGALAKMLPAFRMFVGGKLGSGRQWVSWVHLDDVVGLILLALDDGRAHGAINATAPAPVRGTDFVAALGRVLGRPAWLPAPAFALRAALGEMAGMLLESQRVLPRAALGLGFAFRHPEVEAALRAAVA